MAKTLTVDEVIKLADKLTTGDQKQLKEHIEKVLANKLKEADAEIKLIKGA